MEFVRGLHNLKPDPRGCVVTIGAFDGVHLGHQAVIEFLKREGEELSLPTTVIMFEPLPREYFQPQDAPPRIMTLREKCLALAELGVDRVVCLAFNESLRQMSAEAFSREVFIEGLGAKFIVLGDDFRFGNSREGDLAFLAALGEREGFLVSATPTFEFEGERVSSTRVRAALTAGNFDLAARLLGKPFEMAGKVVHGAKLGRQIGTPTANIQLKRVKSPLHGVYCVTVDGDGLDALPGIANVGVKPTVASENQANLEVHLLDFDGDLYGKRLTVRFWHKLREEQKFESVDVLIEQIGRDVDAARVWHQARTNELVV